MNKIENPMKVKPIFPLLISMSVPTMISMLIQSMYNIVDSIFVSQISENALTAVSLVFPLQNIVSAVAIGFGVGINSCMARSLGAMNNEDVNKAATHGMVLTLIHVLIFVVAGLFLVDPFLRIFTNDEEILRYGHQYATVVICFSFGLLFQLSMEKMFQAVGNMIIPMMMQALGCIINIILCPIMIFGKFGFPALGVLGSAISTITGQITVFIIYIFIFRKKNYDIKMNFKNFRFDKSTVRKLYAVGLPSSIMLSMPSILISVLNGILASISDVSVAVLGIYYKLQTFVYMPTNGLIQGMRPIISYNYGAKQRDRVLNTIKISIMLTSIIMIIGTCISVFFPEKVLMMFNAHDNMMSMGSTALRIISIGFIISSGSVILSGTFEALGDGKLSLIISLVRQFIIIIPLALILSRVLGVNGVWVSFPISEIAASIVSLILFRKYEKLL
nr:MATE family efflux transporter [Clostridium neonatale]